VNSEPVDLRMTRSLTPLTAHVPSSVHVTIARRFSEPLLTKAWSSTRAQGSSSIVTRAR
jgi:hypothetical protein